jgi:hypothetical protein
VASHVVLSSIELAIVITIVVVVVVVFWMSVKIVIDSETFFVWVTYIYIYIYIYTQSPWTSYKDPNNLIILILLSTTLWLLFNDPLYQYCALPTWKQDWLVLELTHVGAAKQQSYVFLYYGWINKFQHLKLKWRFNSCVNFLPVVSYFESRIG